MFDPGCRHWSLATGPGPGFESYWVVPRNGPDRRYYQQAGFCGLVPVSLAGRDSLTPADSPSLSVAKALQCPGIAAVPVVLTTKRIIRY